MVETYQQLLQQWAALAPDECLETQRNYKFKVKILPAVEKCSSTEAWRLITTENFTWHLANGKDFTLLQLNFILLIIFYHFTDRQVNINFTFSEQGTIATICNGLKSQIHPHPALAALDAYVQLLNF
ncbi:hypothetical protein WKK05_37365 (plasmid) [Nostoc sp. UHCC 0302]|uniref:hypothetical protein n=1 Tax=Nostoc sp. UHCC 0302 TaxID=3134896 RepID=UPI00311CAF78